MSNRTTPILLAASVLASCGGELPTPGEAADTPALTRPPPVSIPPPLERYDLRKLTSEALYPERAWQSVLTPSVPGTSTGPTYYDFDSCSDADAEALRARTRVSFAQLGALGSALNPTLAGSTCASGDCFLQVNTAHLGRTVTLASDGTLACEDPETAALGTCALGMSSLTDTTGPRPSGRYRGNVVVADTIRITGPVQLGSLSLILVARTAIEFTGAGALIGAEGTTSAAGRAGTTAPVYTTPPAGCSIPLGGGTGICPTRRYDDITAGGTGSAGAESGSVVLIAPRVITPYDSSNLPGNAYGTSWYPFVRLAGGAGGTGGDAGQAVCRANDTSCEAQVRRLAKAGGAGGPGGRAGNLVVIADSVQGAELDGLSGRARAGGGGGTGGLGTRLLLDDLSTVLPRDVTVVLGATGLTGATGASGYRHDLVLGDQLGALTYLVAGRGADRRRALADRYARTSVAADTTRARAELSDALDLYCEPTPRPLVAPSPISPRVVPAAPGRPSSYLSSGARQAHTSLCRELQARLRRSQDGLDYFGSPPENYMYLRPDVVKTYRDAMLVTFDSVSRQFTDAVAAQSASEAARAARVLTLTDQLVAQDLSLDEKAQRVEIARLRYKALAEAALTKLGWFQINAEELAELRQRLDASSSDVEAALAQVPPRECDFFCVLGDFFSTIISIATAIVNTVNAISSIVNFISNLDEIFDMTRAISELKTAGKITLAVDGTPEGFLQEMKVLGEYANAAVGGLKNPATPGLGAIAGQVGAAVTAWKATVPNRSSNAIPDVLHRMAYDTAESEAQLHEIMLELQTGVARVEAIGQGVVIDREAAIGALNYMIYLVEQQLQRTQANARLFDEHLMALAEMSIAEAELELAMSEHAHARALKTRLSCQLGRTTGPDCAGVVALAGSSERVRALRDEACRASRRVGDAVLLFDYYYERARDFVLLTPRTTPDPSRNFGRNLLVLSARAAFAQSTAQSYQVDFLDTLADASVYDGTVQGSVCWPGEACAGRGGTAYQAAVMSALVSRGRADLEVDAECAPGTPDSRCNPGLSLERARQRVANFDVRLELDPRYRLGCPTVDGCASTPASQPALVGARFVVDYRHEDRATFRWDDGSLRSLWFSSAYPRMACEIIQAYAPGSTVDCRELSFFGGRTEYTAPNTPLPTRGRGDVDPSLYGTSVRGRWSLDLAPTLIQLAGPSGDACYTVDPTHAGRLALTPACLPASCDSADPADASDACGPDSTLEVLCRPYVSSRQDLMLTGDPACCTARGHRRDDLSPAADAACTIGGWTSDDACTVPEPCLEICGPRCQAFKQALRGVSYGIHWRAR